MVSQLSTSKTAPFAEIWYGSHKRLPSYIHNTQIPLEIELPFLLKFLSIDKPLSIQIHPAKEIAMKLFKEDPVHYIDPHAKPELCIPLTEFHCFLGYLDEELIREGLYYRLTDPAKDVLAAWAHVSEDRSKAIVTGVLQNKHGNMTNLYLRLRGLKPGAFYKISCSVEGEEDRVIASDSLMEIGIRAPEILNEYDCTVWHLEICDRM